MRFTGTVTAPISTVVPANTGSFTNGAWNGTVSARTGGSSVFFAADDPATGISGYSNTIAINSSGTLALSFLGTLSEGNGTVANGGTLTLSAAPASALTVALSSANTAQLTVPATVTVPAGQTSVSVPVTLINDTLIEGPQSIAVTAIAHGYTRVTANAAIADNDGGTFTITAPASVAESSSSFIATLNASATSPVAVTVALTSSDTTELTVPASVTLPANASSATFTVTVVNDILFDGTQNATLTASATRWTSGSAVVAVTDNDPPPTFTLYTTTLAEGGTSTTNYVELASAPASALTLDLTSSDTSVMTVPATLTISAGSTYSYFTTSAPENSISTGTRYATLSVSAAGYRSVGNFVSVTENDASGFRISNITGTPVAGAPVSVTITAIAPDNSTVSAFNGTVNLSALADDGAVTVTPPVSGVFTSGVWTGSVVFGRPATGIVLTATDALSRTGSSNAFNTIFGSLDHFTWATVTSPQQSSTPFTATVTAKDVYENTVESFTNSATLSAWKPGAETTSGAGIVSNDTVFPATYDDARCQSIYLPGEVGGAQTIGAVALNISTASATTYTNFTIRMKHTSKADYSVSGGFENTGWTVVYKGAPVFASAGWNQFMLNAPFAYNGTSNLMVDIAWDRTVSASATSVTATTTPQRSFFGYAFTSWGYGNPLNWTGSSIPGANISPILPNMRFQRADYVAVLLQVTGAFSSGAWTGMLSALNSGSMWLSASSAGINGISNTFNVTSSDTLDLALASSALESAAPLTATLTIGTAPAADLVVTLNSNNTAAATVPASATILAGQTNVTFPVTVVDDTLLDGTQSTLISATVVGYDAGTATLSVEDNETTTISLTLPVTLAENAAATTGTVTLGAAAGGDITLPLTSSDTTELSVPGTVTIPSGSTSATFAITPVDDAVIDFAQNVTVSTSMAGWTGGSASISITDNEAATLSLSFTSTTVEGVSDLTATLSTPAPVQNATTVTLTSTDNTEATVPATVTIAAGATNTTFFITIVNDTEKDGAQTFNITGASSGFNTANRALTVTDNDVHNFLVSTVSSPQVRNQPFNVTFTARDVNNTTITSYAGTPALTALDGSTPLTVLPGTVGSFSAGVRTVAVTMSSFASNAVLTLTDASAGASGFSNGFTVGSGPHSRFAWSTIPSPQIVGSAFPVTITAQDSVGNTVTGFTGTANLTAPTGLVSIGSAGSTVSAPLSTNAHDVRSQLIYTAAEMGATARSIGSMALNVSTLPGQIMGNFTIRMRHTTQQAYSSFSWESTGWTFCYQANQTISSTGWNTFTFTTPFAYNGTDNLMVDISFNNSSSSTSGALVSTYISAGVRHIYQTSNSAFGDPLTWAGTSSPGATFAYDRPDVRFGYGGTGATPTPATTTAFTDGVWTGNVTIPSPATAIQLQAASGASTGVSNSFNVHTTFTLGITVPASVVESAGSLAGTVSINPAQASAVTVNLSSNDPTEANPALASVTIPAGSTLASFPLNIINDTLSDGAQTATITASVSSGPSASANIIVNDNDLSYFTWSTIASPRSSGASFSVTISARTVDNQPATGFTGTASLSTTAVSVTPASTGAFSSGGWTGNVSVLGTGSATLTATNGSASGTSSAFTLSMPVLTVTLPASASESTGTVSGTVSLPIATTVNTTVDMTSNDTTEAQPATASVTIPAGSTSVGFTLNIINDSLKDGAQTATITASSSGASSGTASINVTDDDVHNFLVSAISSPRIRNAPFSVTFTARDVNNATILSYSGAPTLSAVDGATALTVSPGSVAGFVSGVCTQNVSIANFASNAVLTITDVSAGASGSSNAFAVSFGSLNRFAVTAIASPQTVGQSFPITITAQDASNNTVSNYTASAALEYTSFGSFGTTSVGSPSGTAALVLSTTSSAARSQHLYLASEIGGAFRMRGIRLTVATAPPGTLHNFTIRMKHTALTTYASASNPPFEDTGWVTVHSSNLLSLPAGVASFEFATPFEYNGVSNLMVDLSFTNSSGFASAGALSTFSPSGFRSAVVQGTPTPSVLSYGTPVGGGTATAAVPVISFIRDYQVVASPASTSAFTAGVWTGNVTVNTPVVGLIIRAAGSSSSQSNAFDVLPATPVILSEPAFTGGTSNTVSWGTVVGTSSYRVQSSTVPDFSAIDQDSGDIFSTSHSFASLISGQHYRYRLRAAAPAVSLVGLWSQTQVTDFLADSLASTGISESTSEVRLARSNVIDVENFDGAGADDLSATLFSDTGTGTFTRGTLSGAPSTTPALPINQGGDMEARLTGTKAAALMPSTAGNVFTDGSIEAYVGPESTASFLYSGLLLRASRTGTGGSLNGYLANIITFAGGSASVSLNRIVNDSEAAGINGIMYPSVSLPSLLANEHWKMRFSANGPTLGVQVWKVRVLTGVVNETLVATMTRTDYAYTSGVAGIYSSQSSTNYSLFDDVTITKGSGGYASTGTITTQALLPPSRLRWGTLAFNASAPSGTSVTVDVLNGSTNALLASAVGTGTSLNALPTVASVSSIKLRANLTTSNTAVTPALLDWSLNYPMADGTPPTSPWSNTVSSTQDATPPVLNVPQFTTTATTATLSGTASDATSGVASVTAAGNAVTTSNAFAQWSRGLTGLVDGANSITVVAADNAVPPNTTSVITTVYRIATPASDPDGNGISALLEHALGIPTGASTARDLLPFAYPETDTLSGDRFLHLDYRRLIQRAGLTYTVETSVDLITWDDSGASVIEESVTPVGDGTSEKVVVRITPSFSLGGAKFVRLRVTIQ
jgi:hypothetical protein